MKTWIKQLLRRNKYLEMLAYILQNNQILNSSGSGEFDTTIDGMYKHSVNVGNLYSEKYSNDLDGKTVLEIGTGYTRSTMLNIIKEFNINKAYCYDRFNCLHENDEIIIKTKGLEGSLDRLEYISGINEELLKIDKNSIDYIISNAVLEHVNDLELLFSILSKLLKEDGTMYHKVDLRCHNRFKNYGELYFHTFSNKFWNVMGGKIGQPNRKLLKDYVKLFEKYNLSYQINILKYFDDFELKKAEFYLKNNNTDDYKVSIVEFKLCKK